MGDGMGMRERARLDAYITGGGSPGIADEVEDFAAPVIIAWCVLNYKHAPLADEIVNAINKAIENEGYKSTTAIALLKSYYGGGATEADRKQVYARLAFARGFDSGVEDESMDLEITDERDYQETFFNYSLGYLAGSFTRYFDWMTPFEKVDDPEEDVEEADESGCEKEII